MQSLQVILECDWTIKPNRISEREPLSENQHVKNYNVNVMKENVLKINNNKNKNVHVP